MIVAPFVTVLQKYNLHLKPISSPLFSLLAVMVVIWQIFSRYWCWPLLQTQRGRRAGGPGGRDLAVPSHARPGHSGHLAGGQAGGSRGPHPGSHHPAPPSQQGQDHEGQQGDHEEAAGASHLHREYLLLHISTLMLHADLKGFCVHCTGFVCFNFNREQPRWCRIFAGAGLKSIFLHDYCTIIHQLPSPGQLSAQGCLHHLQTVLENLHPSNWLFCRRFLFLHSIEKKEKP